MPRWRQPLPLRHYIDDTDDAIAIIDSWYAATADTWDDIDDDYSYADMMLALAIAIALISRSHATGQLRDISDASFISHEH